MSQPIAVTLTSPMVTCGDPVEGGVRWVVGEPPVELRVELRCHVASAEPCDVTVASQQVSARSGEEVAFVLPVPADGPITARGAALAVSWSVVATDGSGAVATSPIVVTPRGGVALWLQRHAPPPT